MNIYVTPDRRIKANNKIIGTSGESGTVRFDFKFPQFIEETSTELFHKDLFFVNQCGCCRKILSGNSFVLTEDIMQGTWVEMQIKLWLGKCVWKTAPIMFELYPALDVIPGNFCKSDIRGESTFTPPVKIDLSMKKMYPEYIPKGKESVPFEYSEISADLPLYAVNRIDTEDLSRKRYSDFKYIPDGKKYEPIKNSVVRTDVNLYGNSAEIIDLTDKNFYIFIDPPEPPIIIDDEELKTDG